MDFCDYCGTPQSGTWFLRATGFTTLTDTDDGTQHPLVKTWCGRCPVPDDIDPAANDAMRGAFDAQRVPQHHPACVKYGDDSGCDICNGE